MTKSIQDIIPTPFVATQQPAPVDVLRSLASHFGKQTGMKVLGDVRTVSLDEKLIHLFLARVPALDNYTLELFRVSHVPTKLYPVRVSTHYSPGERVAASGDELVDCLTQLFESTELRDAVGALVAQAN